MKRREKAPAAPTQHEAPKASTAPEKPQLTPPVAPRISATSRFIKLLIIAAAGLATYSINPAKLFPKGTQEEIEQTEQTSPGIEKVRHIEQKFAEFGEKIKPLIEASTEPNWMKEALLEPFETMAANTKNPGKFLSPGERRKGISGPEIAKQLENRRYFRISFFDEYDAKQNTGKATMVAGGDQIMRLVVLDQNFDPSKTNDILALYHELIHMKQDEHRREKIKDKKTLMEYLKGESAITGYPVHDEVDAYATTVDLLNVLMNGELKKRIHEPYEKITEMLIEKFNLSPGQAWQLAAHAKFYYPDGLLPDGTYSKRYIEGAASIYRSQGLNPYFRPGE